MSIYVDSGTRVLVQGVTGFHGKKHFGLMREYGTNVVAGVTPGKGGMTLDGVPVFDTVEQAVRATGANAAVSFVPPAGAAEGIMECAAAGLDICVCITENIPVQDMARVKRYLRDRKTRLIGPNGPGVITPGQAKLGIMPAGAYAPGRVGVVSRSGSLNYETCKQLTLLGIGQSTCVGIGGDPVKGTTMLEAVQAFAADGETLALVLIGEIGGGEEQEAARWIAAHMPDKPAVAFISGQTAPPGKRMGHAGAVISGESGSARDKMRVLESCGVRTARMSDLIGETLAAALREKGLWEACNTIK